MKTIGIIMNGVTGRMGTNQHLLRSVYAIMEDGGLPLPDGETLMPAPVLVGRNADKLAALSARTNGLPYTTDLYSALANPAYEIYFDAQTTDRRVPAVRKAMQAGKHVYCEKPTASSFRDAWNLYLEAIRSGVKHGVVQDKLWLPGILKLRHLLESGWFGRVLAVKGEFGYWVFTGGSPEEGGDGFAPQRPSWNYRSQDGGGIAIDMLCHWRYILDALFGGVRSVNCTLATHIPWRWDEDGAPYAATADDAAYATFELGCGAIAQFNSSWCTRVRRDDLLTIQVDGTLGSAVCGLRDCWIQPLSGTPRPVWNPDIPSEIPYMETWERLPDEPVKNAFRAQWELFLMHVAGHAEFPYSLRSGALGVQLAECGIRSHKSSARVGVPEPPQ
jgi:predicted dehydrogenase